MSIQSHSYLIFGYKMEKDWVYQDNHHQKFESMIGGAENEPVWIFHDDYVCYMGIPLAVDDGNGIEEKEYDSINREISWLMILFNTLQQKGIEVSVTPKLHTFHIWR